jgi:hypothetical protein
MAYLLEALRGVRGIVNDEEGRPLGGVHLQIRGREQRPFNSTSQGEFWRILLDGSYVLEVPHLHIQKIQFSIASDRFGALKIAAKNRENGFKEIQS